MDQQNEDPIIDCPKCHTPMRQLKMDTCIIDRCETCYGIWLDAGERHKLAKSKKQVELADIGPTDVGRKRNEMTEIKCPRCDVDMTHKEHPAQRHIKFEACPECDGNFFDAGELADMSDYTISERLKSMLGIH